MITETVFTIEDFNGELLVRYRAGDCDVFSYVDFKEIIKKEDICENDILLWLECENMENTKMILNKLAVSNKTNQEKNKKFLTLIDCETKEAILTNIANHYGILNEEAEAEVTDEEAEHILDYITGEDFRLKIYYLTKKHLCN